jgi:hypothetical protein
VAHGGGASGGVRQDGGLERRSDMEGGENPWRPHARGPRGIGGCRMTCMLWPPCTGRWQGGVAAGRCQLMEVAAGCRWRHDLLQWSFAAAR